MKALWITLIIILLLFIIYFFKYFIRFFLYPIPLSLLPARFFAKLIGDDILFSVCSLHKFLQNKLGNANSIGIVILLGDNIELSWRVDKIVIYYCPRNQFKTLSSLLEKIFKHGGYHAIGLINSVNNIEISQIKKNFIPFGSLNNIPIFSLLQVENEFCLRFNNEENLDKQLLDQFLEKLLSKGFEYNWVTIDDILHNFSFIGKIFESSNFIKEIIITDINTCDFNFLNNYIQPRKIYNSKRKQKYILYFFIIISIFSLCLFYYGCGSSYQNMVNAQRAVNFISNEKKDQYKYVEPLHFLNKKNFNPICYLNVNKMNIINKKRQELLQQVGRELLDFKDFPEGYKFQNNPIYEEIFIYLVKQQKFLILSLEKIFDNSNILVKKTLSNYEDLVRNRIFNLYKYFLSNLKNFTLLEECNLFSEKLSNLSKQSIKQEDIREIIHIANGIENIINTTNNNWWIEGSIGSSFNKNLLKIKKIPKIGEDLYEELKIMTEKELLRFRNSFFLKKSVICGSIFEKNQLEFSENIKSILRGLKILDLMDFWQKDYDYKISQRILFWSPNILQKAIEMVKGRKELIDKLLINDPTSKMYMENIIDYRIKKSVENILISNLEEKEEESLESLLKNFEENSRLFDELRKITEYQFGLSLNQFLLIMNNNAEKITKKIQTSLDNSIYTSYLKLKDWDGSSLINFLWGTDNINTLINENIQKLYQIKNYSYSLLKYINNNVLSEYLRYIQDQISKFEKGSINEISIFHSFLRELEKIDVKWREVPEIKTQDKNFFEFHNNIFKKQLIERINLLNFTETKKIFNELLYFFKNKISGFFPFGDGPNVDYKNLAKFILLYEKNRNRITQDGYLISLAGKELDKIQDISDSFQVVNDEIFSSISVDYHLIHEGSKNKELILNYKTIIGKTSHEKQNLNLKYKVLDSFKLEIKLAQSSHMYIEESVEYRVSNKKIIFNFEDSFGLLRFINKFFYSYENGSIILKIEFPITHKINKNVDHIVTFIKIRGIKMLPRNFSRVF